MPTITKVNASTKIKKKLINKEIQLYLDIRKNFRKKFAAKLKETLLSKKSTELDELTYKFYTSERISFAFDKADINYFFRKKGNEKVNCMRAYFGAIREDRASKKMGDPTVILVPATAGSMTNDIDEEGDAGAEWPTGYDPYTDTGFDVSKDNY